MKTKYLKFSQATGNQIKLKSFYIPLEDLANNPSLSHLVNKIFSHLNQNELKICRSVSKSLRDHIDNTKQGWIFQLEHIRTISTTFVDYSGLIETKFPEWKAIFSRGCTSRNFSSFEPRRASLSTSRAEPSRGQD